MKRWRHAHGNCALLTSYDGAYVALSPMLQFFEVPAPESPCCTRHGLGPEWCWRARRSADPLRQPQHGSPVASESTRARHHIGARRLRAGAPPDLHRHAGLLRWHYPDDPTRSLWSRAAGQHRTPSPHRRRALPDPHPRPGLTALPSCCRPTPSRHRMPDACGHAIRWRPQELRTRRPPGSAHGHRCGR